MPYLIDGNNLIYALGGVGCHVGREGLTELLSELAEAGERVAVVYDGAPPDGVPVRYAPREGLVIRYAAPASADAVILRWIASTSAPRHLVVVSSDRELRQAARRRRCHVAPSEEFAPALLAELQRLRRPDRHALPPEKFFGLRSREQRDAWLHSFGMEDLIDEPEDPTHRLMY